jgi:hypothetical protein
MTEDQMELLHRVFAMNEQIVKQNYQIMMVLTQPRLGKFNAWNEITEEEIDFGLAGSNHVFANAGAWRDGVAWAEDKLKGKNNGK